MPITGVKPANIERGGRPLWVLPETLDKVALLKDMGQVFALEFTSTKPVRTSWFDTFDWRLYNRKKMLHHDGDSWYLISRQMGRVEIGAADKPTGKALFPVEFPDRLRALLEPILAMRCLLPLFTDELITSVYRVKNKDDKTIVLVVLEEHHFLETDAVYRTIRLDSVRGYDAACRKVHRFLSNYGVQEIDDPYAFFAEGVRRRGRMPLDYSSRFVLELQPEMSAFQAMTGVYQQLLETMKRNESGIVSDLDTEFLHDFRVAVRRTRSGLGQVKKVLGAGVTEDFKNKFAWLGEITGPTRDLDVYLLYEDNYRARLPESLHSGLRPFFEEIRIRRAGEQKKLLRHLQSKKFQLIVSSWETFLNDGNPDETGDNENISIVKLSRDIIFRKYGRIIKAGNRIGPSTPDEELHRLRIQCKKLRYILEFFASLYPVDEMRRIIKQLKRLQNNLGDFNDLSVQQEMLHRYLISLKSGSQNSGYATNLGKTRIFTQSNQEMAASLGGLLTNLYHEHRRVRRQFAKRFRVFSRPDNGALYTKLFGAKGKG